MTQNRNLIITGATGYFGQHLIEGLSKCSNYSISIITCDRKKAKTVFSHQNMEIFNYLDVKNGRLKFDNIDFLIHLGFTREKYAYDKIAASLKNTNTLFNQAMLQHIKAIVNISSQNVYGLNKPPFWKEKDKLFPELPYGMAKFASELILQGVKLKDPHIKGTSVRLTALAGGSILLNDNELIYKLVDQIVNQQQIIIYGGQQRFERLDVHDAVRAIIKLINMPPEEWKPVYNLGSNMNYSLLEITEKVLKISEEFNLDYPHQLVIEKNEDGTAYGMHSRLFMNQMDWSPLNQLDDIIRSTFIKKLSDKTGE